MSGSVGVISEGVHSLLDLVSAAVGYFTIREAGKPADHGHAFGHGKIETLSSLLEALLLGAAAILIAHEAWERLQHPQPIHYQTLAIITIAVSVIVSYLTYRHNSNAARETESSAIHVNALHFLSDVVAGIGVFVGLVVLKLTGWLQADSIVAFGIAAYILVITIRQVKVALLELSDAQLPESERALIRGIIEEYRDRMIDAHDVRTRRSGATRHIDFHLVVCGRSTVHDSHALCDEIESRIHGSFPSASVNIHVEPCEGGAACEKHCQAARNS